MTIIRFLLLTAVILISPGVASAANNVGCSIVNVRPGPAFERTVFIGAPADKVWEALTNASVVDRYYLVPLVKLELQVGGTIAYGSVEKPMIKGEVVEYVKDRKLVHTFSFSHQPNDPSSRVTYIIEPMGKMSSLVLRHDCFPGETATYKDVSGGWDVILSSLKTILETGKPLPWPQPEKSGGQ